MTMTGNKLLAAEGMVLTNGAAFGKSVFLASGDAPDLWWEITDAEAGILQRDLEQAAAEDYEAALSEMGVGV